MLLAVDVGNTHSVFALCEGQAIQHCWRLTTDAHRTEDEYATILLTLMQQHHLAADSISGMIVASVVPDTLFPLKQLALEYFRCRPLIVGRDDLAISMAVKIDQPRELGADRLVNALAAWEAYRQALIVVDFGTATTFDVVNAEGEYIGGVITPGINVSLEALQRTAAKLHGISICRPEKVIGTHTSGAMQSGIYYGYLGLVEGIVAQIQAEYGTKMKVIATGGLAALFGKDSALIDDVDEKLTIRGLQSIYQHNV